MLASLIGAFVFASVPPINIDYASFRGLQVKVGDVAVIEGSGFQYYEKGWTRGYFSSSWKPVEVTKLSDGSTMVRTNSDDGNVAGTQIFRPTADGFTARAQFRWRGDKPAMLEFTVGRLWSPYFADGNLEIGAYKLSNLKRAPSNSSSFEDRLLGSARTVIFNAPSATIEMTFNKNVSVLDGRNYSAEWAKGKELFWLGFTDQLLTPQSTATYEYTVKITPELYQPSDDTSIETEKLSINEAFGPDRKTLPLFPRPKSVSPHTGYLDCTAGFEFNIPENLAAEASWFQNFISQTYIWQPNTAQGSPAKITARASNLNLPPGGYKIESNASGVTILGQDEDGIRYAIRTLALLAKPQGGRLIIPSTTITDYPSCRWRGVHMFVGPQAKDFQGKLINRVLAISKFNKVVLQCERTNWNATKGIETSMTMSKPDLQQLVSQYRSLGFEFIPLIQSLGHAEWFFANNQNLDIAINPKVPYTIDLRKERAKSVLTNLWQEVATDFQPKTVHFGLDEIHNRGFSDEFLATRLWTTAVPFLHGISHSIGAKMMIWSDMMLHPSEAPDAAHAKTLEAAAERKRVVPKGTLIADWHYKDDPNPEIYKSLKLWRSAGMNPVASGWFRPNNIRGLALAAIENNCGYLQTTWAGYESNEANMVKAWEQFTAYLLAAEYTWSGRKELPEQLNFDAGEMLQRLFYGERQPLASIPGVSHVPQGTRRTTVTKIGTATFRMFEPIQLFGVTTQEAFRAPLSVDCPLDTVASEVLLALDCISRANDASKIATVEITTDDGQRIAQDILYGTHVRAISDNRAPIACRREDGASAIRIHCEKATIKNIRVTSVNSAAGVRLRGVTTF
ncbi:glycoside hydrolase family 20 zincin-like fold domain-containing protein [Kamptonema cortianum]|nr:glycoside hydrolase family 20 zincin-like fold domain-containing protein [Geitlerinema splendidum]MDK3158542.1 glycoside hydrolase family 20 zincin-like fold domain-containing protein [Kamptonema cortianum]